MCRLTVVTSCRLRVPRVPLPNNIHIDVFAQLLLYLEQNSEIVTIQGLPALCKNSSVLSSFVASLKEEGP